MLFEYIESFYNLTRYHSTNGGKSPNARERAFHEQQSSDNKNSKNNKNSNKDPEMEKARTTVAFA